MHTMTRSAHATTQERPRQTLSNGENQMTLSPPLPHHAHTYK